MNRALKRWIDDHFSESIVFPSVASFTIVHSHESHIKGEMVPFAVLGIGHFADAFHSQRIGDATEQEGRWDTLDVANVDWIVESLEGEEETEASHFTTSDDNLSHSNVAHLVGQIRRFHLEMRNNWHGKRWWNDARHDHTRDGKRLR